MYKVISWRKIYNYIFINIIYYYNFLLIFFCNISFSVLLIIRKIFLIDVIFVRNFINENFLKIKFKLKEIK